MESNWGKDCTLHKKPLDANKVRSSENNKSQKQSINLVMNNNADFDSGFYRDSPNKRENFQRIPIKEAGVVTLVNDSITSDYHLSLQGNYVSACSDTYEYIGFDNEDKKEEDVINNFEEDSANQNMYDSDNNEIIDQNLFNPQNMIASIYCRNINTEDSEMVNLPQGENERKTSSEVSFQHKTMDSVNYDKIDMNHSCSENSFNNFHIPPDRIESGNYENLSKYYESGIQGTHDYVNTMPKNMERHYKNAALNDSRNHYSSFKNVSNDYSRSLFGNFCNYKSPLASQSNVNMDQTQYILETQSQPTVVSTQTFQLQNNNDEGKYQFHSQVHRKNISRSLEFSQFEKSKPKNKLKVQHLRH